MITEPLKYLKKNGSDFCCKGNRRIEEACENKKINVSEIYEELENLQKINSQDTDFKSWPLDLLADYVEKVHHNYISDKTPVLLQFLHKVSKVHGERHPELVQIYSLFSESAADLAAHMKKEELILFSVYKNDDRSRKNG